MKESEELPSVNLLLRVLATCYLVWGVAGYVVEQRKRRSACLVEIPPPSGAVGQTTYPAVVDLAYPGGRAVGAAGKFKIFSKMMR